MKVYVATTALFAPAEGASRVETIGDEQDMKTKRLPRIDRLAIAAARKALGSAPVDGLALLAATDGGGLKATADFLEGIAARGPQFGSPTAFHESVHHALAGQISIILGITGLSLTCSAREISGETALRAGADLIAQGRAKRALVVSAEESFAALEAAYRAFGSPFVPVEGAAAVLLTTEATDVELASVEVGSRPVSTLRFTEMPSKLEQGLIRVVRAVDRIREGAEHERIASFAMGGGEATVVLQRTPSPPEGRGPG